MPTLTKHVRIDGVEFRLDRCCNCRASVPLNSHQWPDVLTELDLAEFLDPKVILRRLPICWGCVDSAMTHQEIAQRVARYIVNNRPSPGDGLAVRATIPQTVAIYEEAVRNIHTAFDLLDKAEVDLGRAFGRTHESRLSLISSHRGCRFDRPDQCIEDMTRTVWRNLVEKLEVKRFMSIKAARDLDKKIEHDELPRVSTEAVSSMLKGFMDTAETMLDEAVGEVFELLRPHNSKYKRNSEFEVPRTVVLSYVIERWIGRLHVRYERDQELIALENVLHALAGRGSIAKSNNSELKNAVDTADRGETFLFRYRACRNGTLHLTFKDKDLLARFNQRAGGARLRGAK